MVFLRVVMGSVKIRIILIDFARKIYVWMERMLVQSTAGHQEAVKRVASSLGCY